MSAPDGIRFKSNDMRHMSLNALLNKAVNDYIRAIEHICEHDALEKCSSILERHGWVRCDVNIDQLKAENAKLRELLGCVGHLLFILDVDYCVACPRDSISHPCPVYTIKGGECLYKSDMRELGVEVE